MKERELAIVINPEPKGRPRAAMVGGHARVYTPSKTANYENAIRYAYQQEYGNEKPFEKAIHVCLMFFFPYPKSAYWPKNSKHPNGELKESYSHTSKPDLDNLVKAVLDALNGIAFKDDSQICAITASKRYTTNSPEVYISIEEKDLV